MKPKECRNDQYRRILRRREFAGWFPEILMTEEPPSRMQMGYKGAKGYDERCFGQR